jgi:hypothetical protein
VCRGVSQRLPASSISHLNRRFWLVSGRLWTVPDDLGNPMLGECWVEPADF